MYEGRVCSSVAKCMFLEGVFLQGKGWWKYALQYLCLQYGQGVCRELQGSL